MQGQILYYFRAFFSWFISARCGGLEEDNGKEVRESKITDMDIENMGKQGLLLDDDDDDDDD